MSGAKSFQDLRGRLQGLPREMLDEILDKMYGKELLDARCVCKISEKLVREKLNRVRQIKILPEYTKYTGDQYMRETAFILFEKNNPATCLTFYAPALIPGSHLFMNFTDSALNFLAKNCKRLEVIYAPYSLVSAPALQQFENRLSYFAICQESRFSDKLEIEKFTKLKAFDFIVPRHYEWTEEKTKYFIDAFPGNFIQFYAILPHSLKLVPGNVLYLSIKSEYEKSCRLPENLAQSLQVLRVMNATFYPTPTLNNLLSLDLHGDGDITTIINSVKGATKLKILHIHNEMHPCLVEKLTALLRRCKQMQCVQINFQTEEYIKEPMEFTVPVGPNLVELRVITDKTSIKLENTQSTSYRNLSFIELTSAGEDIESEGENTVVKLEQFADINEMCKNLISVKITNLPEDDDKKVLKALCQCEFIKSISIEYNMTPRPIDEAEKNRMEQSEMISPSILKGLDIIPSMLESQMWSLSIHFAYSNDENGESFFRNNLPDFTLHNGQRLQGIASIFEESESQVLYVLEKDTTLLPREILRQLLSLMRLDDKKTDGT